MTEYVATRWYRAPEVMLCRSINNCSMYIIALETNGKQRSKNIQRLSICGVWDASLLK